MIKEFIPSLCFSLMWSMLSWCSQIVFPGYVSGAIINNNVHERGNRIAAVSCGVHDTDTGKSEFANCRRS